MQEYFVIENRVYLNF